MQDTTRKQILTFDCDGFGILQYGVGCSHLDCNGVHSLSGEGVRDTPIQRDQRLQAQKVQEPRFFSTQCFILSHLPQGVVRGSVWFSHLTVLCLIDYQDRNQFESNIKFS